MAGMATGRTAAGKKTRVQRSEEVRDALFQAAAEVVGEYGYIDASITRITQRANLAQGTFYNYFASRQEIFDELLPVLGAKMLAHIRQQAGGAKTFLEKEELSFRAFFSFLKRMPYFLRILNEAEIFAPKAHRQHFRNITAGYLRFLQNARKNGEIAALTDEALEPLVYMLIASRGYLALRYTDENGVVNLPEEAVAVYLQLLGDGLARRAPVG
ncbi:Transcriptional regulator, AcrR family [Azospirillum doebereinerae]